MSLKKHQYGISLVELMITLALSSMLMLGVTRMFADSVSNNLSDTALAQVQDSARIAMSLLKKDIRMAGFQGGPARTQQLIPNSIIDLSQQPPLVALDSGSNSTNTDSLIINRAYSANLPDPGNPDKPNDIVRIVSFYSDNSSGNKLVFDRAICLDSSDVFLITDGENLATVKFLENADCSSNLYRPVSEVTPIGKSDNNGDGQNDRIGLQQFSMPTNCSNSKKEVDPVNNIENCPVLYQLGVGSASEYSIRSRTNADDEPILASDGLPIPALFFSDDEMVEGVENIQILYGIEESSGVIKYENGCTKALNEADNCAQNNKNITHVKISLVVVSSFPVFSQNTPQAFPLANLNANASILQTDDRRLRRVFTSTVQLRNSG